MVGFPSSFLLFLQKIRNADIVKVFSLTALSTIVRMLTGLISVKVVAVIIGPAGIALLGQLGNFSTIVQNFATLGINNGVTKYIAEFKDNESQIKRIISTAFRIAIIGSLTVGVFMVCFYHFLSRVVMLSDEYGYVFIVFGLTLVLYAVNNILISILNGYKEFKKYVTVNIVSTILGLFFTLCLVLLWEIKGALISAVTFQSVMLFVTLFMLRDCKWLSREYFTKRFDLKIAKKYLSYTLMTLVSISVAPVSQLILRGYVISHISEVEAGWWEAMNRISGVYLLVITSSFSVYYLPRLSEIKNDIELRSEIFKAYKVIMPMLISGFVLIYFTRFLVIRLLFTSDFIPMQDLFIWQLAGDLFKIGSWILAYLMIAKTMTRAFILTEILAAVLYVGLAFLFIPYSGVMGITQAYFVNYVIYMGVMLFIFRKIVWRTC